MVTYQAFYEDKPLEMFSTSTDPDHDAHDAARKMRLIPVGSRTGTFFNVHEMHDSGFTVRKIDG